MARPSRILQTGHKGKSKDEPKNEPEDETKYRYEDLDQRESVQIRLLRLLPGREGSPIEFVLEYWPLINPPPYIAVSYAWGTGSQTQGIRCGQRVMRIGRTIYEYLTYARQLHESLLLWVDSVCINQANITEKSEQVGIMGSIYGATASVNIWLGEKGSETETIHEMIAEHNNDRGPKLTPSEEHWECLRHLLQRSWFVRTWVLQEVLLVKTCRLRCGSYFWPWPSLDRLVSRYRGLFSDRLDQGNCTLRGVLQFGLLYTGMPKHDMVEPLAAARSTEASNPRDKVYAVLPLLRYAGDRPVDKKLTVNYSETVQLVYKRTAARCLQNGDLTLFNHAGNSRSKRM